MQWDLSCPVHSMSSQHLGAGACPSYPQARGTPWTSHQLAAGLETNIHTHIHTEGQFRVTNSPMPWMHVLRKPEDVHRTHKPDQEPSSCEVTTVPPLGCNDIFIKILNVAISQKPISIWFSQQGTKKRYFLMFFIVLFALLSTKGSTFIIRTWFNFNPTF